MSNYNMDLEFSSGILDTPSIITANMGLNPLVFEVAQDTMSVDVTNNNNNQTNSEILPVMNATQDKLLTAPLHKIDLTKIKDDLKQSFIQPRRATQSIFEKMAKSGVLTTANVSVPPTQDGAVPDKVPSTADVMNDIESFGRSSAQESTERDTTTGIQSDNNHLDTSLPSNTMGVIVSPKKQFLIRSQSHTDPASPTSISINSFSQTQKTNYDDTSSTDDDHSSISNADFQRFNDAPIVVRSIDTNPQLENHIKASFTLPTDQNLVHSTMVKQQPVTPTNKRTFHQITAGGPISKANTLIITNEVSSSNSSVGVKRSRTTPTTKSNSNSTFLSTNNDNQTQNNGSDDQRRKQIRDSNREAARRCRERRRQYIEQLEGNLEDCKLQIKQLNEKLATVERENTQLRAILTETKIFHTTTHLSSNEPVIEFVNVIPGANVDISTDTTDGNIIQRNYYTRNVR